MYLKQKIKILSENFRKLFSIIQLPFPCPCFPETVPLKTYKKTLSGDIRKEFLNQYKLSYPLTAPAIKLSWMRLLRKI